MELYDLDATQRLLMLEKVAIVEGLHGEKMARERKAAEKKGEVGARRIGQRR